MKSFFTLLLAVGSMLLAGPAQAQYTFSPTNLNPYKQDFNTLSGTIYLTDGHLNTLPEVYAQAEFPGNPYSPLNFGANDGQNVAAGYYHFGYADASGTDRSLGGIASTAYTTGVGYVGIRLKNTSGVTIKNLEVQYAMEQWYNSGRQDQASVAVTYYQAPVGTAITSLNEATGTWKTIAPLQVDAPSTSTVIANRDGNAATNRRVRQTTLVGINLLNNQEIMIRWGYALNTTTNGNGLSIDDVVITPETNIFYSKTTGNLDLLTNWGQNRDGSGTAPANFTAANQTFYVLGSAADDRISNSWTVSGDNSKIVVGVPATAATGMAAIPAGLRLEYNRTLTGPIDVSDNSTFVIRNTNARLYTLGSLSTSSTVEYTGNTITTIIPQSYGHLVLSGNASPLGLNTKTLAGNVLVYGSLRLKNQCSLSLLNYDLTMVRRDSVTANGIKVNANIVRGGSPTSYIATDGMGKLRISVPSNGVGIVFPVGSGVPSLLSGVLGTNYTPATLRQTAANSEDIFGVRVITNMFLNYTLAEVGILGSLLNTTNVNKTWLVSEEVTGGSNLTMTLQWNTADAALGFSAASARLKHYTGGAWDENTTTSEWGASSSAGTQFVTRSGITSFSPFGVLSNATPLPVTLTAFDVQLAGTAALCTWATASETNNDHFVVERSLDGNTFAALGTVAGQGSTTASHAYHYLDAGAGRQGVATVYYRLQQVDTDGKASYSPVRAVTFAAQPVALYPTPTAGDAATLDLSSLAAQPYQAQVLDLTGRVLFTRTLAGGLAHDFDVRSLPAGAYVLVLSGAGVRQTLPLLRN
ncbi:MAG: T9SS type A sorting domain-containing protein [Janthinobacterium lividum]